MKKIEINDSEQRYYCLELAQWRTYHIFWFTRGSDDNGTLPVLYSPLLWWNGSPFHELCLKRHSRGTCTLETSRKRRWKGEQDLEKHCSEVESLWRKEWPFENESLLIYILEKQMILNNYNKRGKGVIHRSFMLKILSNYIYFATKNYRTLCIKL